MTPPVDAVTPMYAALIAALFVVLSVRTLRLRRRLKIGVGDGGDPRMLRAMRAHANFAEYVPLTLLLLMFFELRIGQPLMVHALGALLVVGRLVHAYGVSQVKEDTRLRVAGMAMTFTPLSLAAVGVVLTGV